jgi:hypothetical protein
MKVLNYIVCSTIILVGMMLLLSGEFVPSLIGVLYLLLNIGLRELPWFQKLWKKYLKTSEELSEYFFGK